MKIREYTFEAAEAHAEVHRERVRGIASKDYRDEVIEAWASKEPEDSPLGSNCVNFEAEFLFSGRMLTFAVYV